MECHEAPAASRHQTAVIIDACGDTCDIVSRSRGLLRAPDDESEVIILCEGSRRESILASLASLFRRLSVAPVEDGGDGLARLLNGLRANCVAFLPRGSRYRTPPWDALPSEVPFMTAWLSDTPAPRVTAREYEGGAIGWLASRYLVDILPALGPTSRWTLSNFAAAARSDGRKFIWPSLPAGPPLAAESAHAGRPEVARQSSVLAIIPHYGCEPWLPECLESLAGQTRRLEGIAVIDDHSGEPPVEITRRFPQVSLLATEENVGPYRIVQEVIDRTGYDAYLFQDADDWSTRDRLESLLAEAERTGAGLIGSQELRVVHDTGEVFPVCYPVDVNAALAVRPAHPLLHPTSLVSRALVQSLGGFATGLRFGGDSEFLLRAVYRGRVVNLPRYCYFRRLRRGSLMTSAETGIDSPARLTLQRQLRQRAERNAEAKARGQAPDLAPYATAGPVGLVHVAGPPLRGAV